LNKKDRKCKGNATISITTYLQCMRNSYKNSDPFVSQLQL